MTARQPVNLSSSVRQRLENKAKNDNRPFAELLQYYAMERVLYRLSRSAWADKFILKGGLLLRVWQLSAARPTMDIDVLGLIDNDPGAIRSIMQEILTTPVEPDGLVFDTRSIRTRLITEKAASDGLEVKFSGKLGNAQITIRLDIGIGDSYYPALRRETFPSLLEKPTGEMLCYPRESVIAEKLETMFKLGEINSRMKDFYDIWILSRQCEFIGATLTTSIVKTMDKRGTLPPPDLHGFFQPFLDNKQSQWNAFRKRLGMASVPERFESVIQEIVAFLTPVLESIKAGTPPPERWDPCGKWR